MKSTRNAWDPPWISSLFGSSGMDCIMEVSDFINPLYISKWYFPASLQTYLVNHAHEHRLNSIKNDRQSNNVPLLGQFHVGFCLEPARDLDINTEMTNLAVISMHSQLQQPNIPEDCTTIKSAYDH